MLMGRGSGALSLHGGQRNALAAARGLFQPRSVGVKAGDEAVDEIVGTKARDFGDGRGDVDDRVAQDHAELVVIEESDLHGPPPRKSSWVPPKRTRHCHHSGTGKKGRRFSGSGRRQEPSARPIDRLAAAFEGGEHRRDRGDRRRGRGRIDDHDIGGIADFQAVVAEVHEPRRALRDHGEQLRHALGLSDLQDIGMQVGHADQRAVAERCERVQDVVR